MVMSQRLPHGRSRKHPLGRQQEVQCAAKAVDVRSFVGGMCFGCLFGSHVICRAHHHAGTRELLAVRIRRVLIRHDEACQAEVQDLDHTLIAQQQVARFNVPVDHSAFMGVLQALGRLSDEVHRASQRQRAGLSHERAQILPLNIFHDEKPHPVDFSRIVSHHNIRMHQLSSRLHLSTEPLSGIA